MQLMYMQAGADPRLKADCFDYLVKHLPEVVFDPLRTMPANVAAQVVGMLSPPHSYSLRTLSDP